MRMWMVDPDLLCNQHLLGEHGELHKHRHNFIKRHNMLGRKGQIFPLQMGSRHEELAREMVKRGMKHQSPYEQPDVGYLKGMLDEGPDIEGNLIDLMLRCEKCCKNIELNEETGK